MSSREEKNRIYAEITETKTKMGNLSVEIGRLNSAISRIYDDINQAKDFRREVRGGTGVAEFNITCNINSMYDDIEKLRAKKNDLFAEKNRLNQHKEELYAKLRNS